MNFKEIFKITGSKEFEQKAIDVFRYQAYNCSVYEKYLDLLECQVDRVNTITKIPFLPISFFKKSKVITGEDNYDKIFFSSGTTGNEQSKHYVSDLTIYEKSFTNSFRNYFGDIENYCILALLPSYLEREGSSLIYMTDKLIYLSKHPDSGFYLDNFELLKDKLESLNNKNQKTILLGVSFALLDFAEKYQMHIDNCIIMETGGMKGRRKEITKDELHKFLCERFGVKRIYSEYGMTELLSQAYSFGKNLFNTPPWMKILIRDIYDPFSYISNNKTGGINVIDLANINSCSFIETQDLGKLYSDNSFEVLGRFDNSDLRGCNLML